MELEKEQTKQPSNRDVLQQYRQPMVTATGIFLGFMLEFANGWLPSAFSRSLAGGLVVSLTLTSSIGLLIVVLYRILRRDYPSNSVETFYKRTLRLFILGISIPFFSIMVGLVFRFAIKISSG